MRDTKRERQRRRQREKQALGRETEIRLIMPGASGRCSTAEPPRCPNL